MHFILKKSPEALPGIAVATIFTIALMVAAFLFIEAGPKSSVIPEPKVSDETSPKESSASLLPPEVVELEERIAVIKSEAGKTDLREEIDASKSRMNPVITEMRSRIADSGYSGVVSAPDAEELIVEREKIRQRLEDLRSRSAVLSNGTIE